MSKRTKTTSSIRVLLILGLAVAAASAWQRWGVDQHPPGPPASPSAPAADGPATGAPQRGGDTRMSSRRDLSIDESRGGHTLARHVGKSDDALRDRLARERGISAASTYNDRATAEAVVARALSHHESRVTTWTSRTGNRPNLALSYNGDAVIGRTLVRGRRDPIPSTDAVVVLRWDRRGFYVLTSYPEARR